MTHLRRVGIDLAPASLITSAPGTARLVQEQARALFRLPVHWQWVPLVEATSNPLWPEVETMNALVVPGHKVSLRATLAVGRAWHDAGCDLGFCTAFFVPFGRFPVVANFFDSTIYEHPNTWITSGRRRSYYLLRALSWYAIKRAHRLFINSQYCLDKLRLHFPRDARKFVVNPCGLTHRTTAPLPPPAWASRLHRPFVLFAGIFSDNKNQWRLIHAWERLQSADPDFPALLLIGPCADDYYTTRIAPVLATLSRPDGVVITRFVPDAELDWAYQNAYAYIQPSIAEGFNLCVIEAMSFALPVACASTTSHPEVVGESAILFDPFSPDSIQQAALRLVKDTALRERLISAGQQRSTRFTWDQNARTVRDEIERVLERLAPRQ